MKRKRQTSGPAMDANHPAIAPPDMAHLASFPEYNPNPVIELDAGGRVYYQNPAASSRFPDLPERGRKHPFLAGWDALAARITGEKLPLLTRELYVGERWYEQAISYAPSFKRFRIYSRDITKRREAEQSLIHLNRELRAITACNQAIVRANDEITLYTDVCRIMCDIVGYLMAWVGSVEHDEARSIRPIAWHGDDHGYLERAHITWADTELGRGPTGTAARTVKTHFCQDFLTDPKTAPWREAALARGYRSSIAIPLSDSAGNIFAVFNLYAGQPDLFTPAEIGLLEDLAGDVSFGIGALREKAERQQAEAREKRIADEWQTTFDSITDMVSIQDKDCRLIRVNKAYAAAAGAKPEDLIGQKCYAMIHHADQAIENCPHPETMLTRNTVTREIFEPGLGIYLEVTTSPVFDESGGVAGSVHIAKDITGRKKVEQMKDEFIGLVSHELRTPLTVITGSLRTAMSAGLTAAEVRELLQNAAEGADQLAVILENMLELSRYQAGHLKLRLEPVSIAATVRTVIKKLTDQRVSQSFSVDIPGDLPAVEADPVRVERIAYNLLENATKYSPGGSRIKISARAEEGFIVTAIADQGPGISPDDQKRLFEQFQQLETRHRSTTGAGLGLVVCKRLVEAQKGRIKVDSEPGKGSVFSFALPKSAAPD